jgi:2,3-dihydroxybenzoate decarboxylase
LRQRGSCGALIAAGILALDATGIAMQVLSLTSPGVQVFDAATAVTLAKECNDQLAAATAKHPTRFAGLAAIAPQIPKEAAKELKRGVRALGLKGAILNSHTLGEYLDDPKFWDIFAAAEALDVPLYLHPNSPSAGLIQPLLQRGLDGAIYGFGVDTGMHLLSIITSGAFSSVSRYWEWTACCTRWTIRISSRPARWPRWMRSALSSSGASSTS